MIALNNWKLGRPDECVMALFVQLVRFSAHNKIVAMQASDLMGPPTHSDLTPLCEQCWMVILFLSNLTHSVGKCERIDEITERVDPSDTWLSINVYFSPTAMCLQKII